MQEATLTVPQEALPELYNLLEQGVGKLLTIGRTVLETMRQELGLSEADVDRVQTVFLNSSPVDDLATARVRDLSTFSLSAAMPGLVGATMRRGGPASPLRGGIRHIEPQDQVEERPGRITLKLFNVLRPELGPRLLAEGVVLSPRQLAFARKKLQGVDYTLAPDIDAEQEALLRVLTR